MNKKGKSFIQRKQRLSDNYYTPYSITEQLLENERFDYNKIVLDPACGNDAIKEILDSKFYLIKHYDINHKDINFKGDFFLETDTIEIDYIITNPPFSLAFEFIQKAKEIAKEKFAMLLPLNYLHGQKRYEQKIFRDENYPLTKVYVFTRYPMLTEHIRADGKYKTGMIVYCWMIWEKKILIKNKLMCNYYNIDIANTPIIKWIDNNKYVLKKGE
jgi:hypothetical protein